MKRYSYALPILLLLIIAVLYFKGVFMSSSYDPAKPYVFKGPLTPEEQSLIFPKCVKEADHSPALSEELTTRFRAVRKRESSPYYKDDAEKQAITKEYIQLMEDGNWKAQFNLAFRYVTGNGTKKNYDKATILLEDLVEKNIPLGIYGMSLLLKDGKGVQQNSDLASQYMHRAAELGSPEAQYSLGMAAHSRHDDILAMNYLSCAAEQGIAEAGYRLGIIIDSGEQNFPKSARYYLLGASNGHLTAISALSTFFEGGYMGNLYGFDPNPELVECIEKYRKLLMNDPSAKFPEMLTECKIPLHPVMGDGSQYPQLESRVAGFLDRLKSGQYDPEWEEAKARERMLWLQEGYWDDRKSAAIEPIKYTTIPLEGIDQWTMEQVQSGEYFVKRNRTWIYVKDGAEVPSRISGYLESVLNTHYVNVLEVEAFHEETDGQFKAMLRTMLG